MHKLRHNKKSQFGEEHVIILILDIIMILSAIAGSIGYLTAVKNGTLYDRNYLSRDISFLIDTLYSLPGNVLFVYNYPNLDLSKMSIKISDNSVLVSEKENNGRQSSFLFASNKNLNPIKASIDYQPIIFSKSGNNLELTQLNLNMVPCGVKRYISPPEKSSVYFDIGGNPAEQTQIGALKESKINSIIAFSAAAKLNNIFSMKYSRQADQIESILADNPRLSEQQIKENVRSSGVLIGVNIGGIDNKKSLSYVKAYYLLSGNNESNDSKYLACSIVNSIVHALPSQFDAASVIPLNPLTASPKFRNFLREDKISVYVEIGNSLNPNPAILMNDELKLKKIGEGIGDAIKGAII